MNYRADCIHFVGCVPCKPNKMYGAECSDCSYYTQRKGRILVIKLGAAGDVIRTTVILSSIREVYPEHEIWWITETPQLLPSSVHKRLEFNLANTLLVQATEFDVVYSLDKDAFACALELSVTKKQTFGFTLQDGLPAPANELARHKFITGIFDRANKANTLSYQQEILELCGFTYTGQEYELDVPGASPLVIESSAPVVGLNTGCGDRWVSREWPLDYWKQLITQLADWKYTVVLLGGPAEHERNIELSSQTQAVYRGTYSLPDFVAVVNRCDVVVSAVTMAMHVAIAMKKPLVLMNNIFNKHEFELYGRGEIIEPPLECQCFFGQTCTNTEYRCMDHLMPQTVADAVKRYL
ncbi:MAG: glycosyltransferase family 9 protein [Bradyrhizobiaceae bacterium]|nr:glycosyltransferase family 9 protein [Bradyrhizobiaceae bacterium]